MPNHQLQDLQADPAGWSKVTRKMDYVIDTQGTKGCLAGWTASGVPVVLFFQEGENRTQLWKRCDEAKTDQQLVSYTDLVTQAPQTTQGNADMTTNVTSIPAAPVAPAPVAPAPVATAPVAPVASAPVAPVASAPVAPVASAPVAPVASAPVAPPVPVTPQAPLAQAPIAPTAPVATAPVATAPVPAEKKTRRGKKDPHATIADPQLAGPGNPALVLTVQQGAPDANGVLTRSNFGSVSIDLTTINPSAIAQLAANALSLMAQQKTRSREPSERMEVLNDMALKLANGDLSLFERKQRVVTGRKPKGGSRSYPLEVQALAQAFVLPLLIAKSKWESLNEQQRTTVMSHGGFQQAMATLEAGGGANELDNLIG